MNYDFMTSNCYFFKGDIVIIGACVEQVSKIGYNKATKNANQVFCLCLEDTHINMAITKLSAIISMNQVTDIKFVTVDRSPHCTQMHYIKHEIERTLKDHIPMSSYVIIDDDMICISDHAIELSKSLSILEKIQSTDI